MNFALDFFYLFKNPHVLFTVQFLCFLFKIILLSFLFFKGFKSKKIPQALFYLIGTIASGIIVDSSWLLKFIQENYFAFDYRIVLFLIRIAWAFNLIQLQSLGIFIETLGEKNYKITLYQIPLLIINAILVFYFIYVAFFHFNITNLNDRSFECQIISFTFTYIVQILLLSPLFLTIRKLRLFELPKILKKQLTLFLKFFIAPYLLIEFIESHSIFTTTHELINCISTPLLTCALFYSMKKLIGIRFLNFQKHVQAKHRFNFIDDFKNLLEQLSKISNVNELGHVTQMFFKDAFAIIPNRIHLYFRKLENNLFVDDEKQQPTTIIETTVENFMSIHNKQYDKIQEALKEYKIIIYDEIAFSNFYEDNEINQELLRFMESINADIFLPIYDQQLLISYIIVEREARINKLYSNVERDEMLVFSSYLGNIINLLQNRNLNRLIQREKDLREELYCKHQEINQYRESIRSFLRDHKQRKIGILFYKNRRFVFGNKEAKELIDININILDGHPLTKAFKQLVLQVEEYKSSQSCLVKDNQRNALVLSAIPHLEQNNIIIIVYYPELSDVIKKQIEYLRNPSEWDYLLYLETTKSGQLINQLIPGSREQLLNFKIELLKIALSKKALLLEMAEEDLMSMVEILHNISLREQLHIIKLNGPVQDSHIAVMLFGINPIFETKENEPLMEKLNNVGTLFIQNIHFLDLETQQYLAEYIKYGFYHKYKSDQRITSNVRIICSTNQNITTLIQENKLSKQLYNELKHTTIIMPSLSSLPEEELNELAEGLSEQALASPLFNNLFELSSKEKYKLIHSKPISLHNFKEKIRQLLVQKTKKNNIYQETQFDPAYNIADPALTEAARLGKKALQDPKIMAMLWNKFKNQNQIATFLGVNRSSVNRRCKEYNLY